jgi:hypothetical protein
VSLLSSQALLEALHKTSRPIRLRESEREQSIAPETAIAFAISGTWEGKTKGKGEARRVVWIRRLDTRPPAVFQICYRTAEAATLPPTPEYLRSIGA